MVDRLDYNLTSDQMTGRSTTQADQNCENDFGSARTLESRLKDETYHLSAAHGQRRVVCKAWCRGLTITALSEQDVNGIEGDRKEVVEEKQRFGGKSASKADFKDQPRL